MKPAHRCSWIASWMQSGIAGRQRVDVLDSDFVVAYVEATNAHAVMKFIGAPYCAQLSRDLGSMFKKGTLKRTPVGLAPGDASMGFPKWVYVYSLAACEFES